MNSFKGTFKAWLDLARISNSPTVVSNVLAGVAIASVMPLAGSHVSTVATLMLSMLMFYAGGMFLNDIFDYEIDREVRPERPLAQGKIRRITAMIVTVILFLTGLALLILVGVPAFGSGLVLIAFIFLYNYWHKNNPFAPFIMALTRVMVYVTSFLAVDPALAGSDLMLFSVLLFFYVSGLTFIAASEDRSDLLQFWPVALLLPAPVFFLFRVDGAGLALVIFFLIWIGWSLHYAYRSRDKQIGGAIVRLIAGISIFDALVLVSFAYLEAAWVALALFVLTRFFQRYIKGS